MASYRHLSQQTKPRFESPAKVFAKLKSRVQREARCATEEGFTGKDLLCNARYKHGGEFKSPRKRAESTWISDEHKENQGFGSYRNEVHAMTISPISSPQKTFSCSNISHKTADAISPVTERGHGYTPRQRAFLESTAVSQPHFLVRQQIHTEPPQIRDLGGFSVTSRTPVKMQPVNSSCLYEEGCAPLMSPVHRFPPMSLRKRKWEPLGCNNIGNSIREISSEVISQPKGQKPSRVSSEDDTHNNTCMEDLGHVSRFSVDQPEMNQVTCEHVFKPPRSIAKKRCHDLSEKGPPMSPAKMFAYMKERERQKEQQEVFNVSSSTWDLFGGGFHQSRAPPPSTDDNVGQMGDITFRGTPESVASADPSRAESAGCQSDTDPSEDAQTPALPSQPCLFEDPLVLNTPRVSIPRNNEGVFKRNKWPQRTKFPSESVVYLSKWFLRRNHKGLFVDGIRREENIPWNSNIIVDRVSNYVLKTVTGRVYILVGKMNLDVDVGFPKWFLKKFVNGFPQNWKALHEKFLSESKHRETGRDLAAKTKPDASSAGLSVKRQRRKPLKTPASSPPAPSSSTQVSRSGRVIKPPLEYWKGGRVILDAQMNVTIHECYDTSICIPEVTKKVARASKKPAHVFVPCNEGRKQCPSASINEAPVPLRKVKAPARKRDRATVKPTTSPESPVETISSPEEQSGRRTSSRQRHQAATRMSHVDTVPQKQSKPEKTSTRRSKKQTPDKTSPVARALRRKPEVGSSSESPAAADETSPDQSSTDDSPTSRKKRGKAAHRKRGEKSQPSPSSESEGSGKELRKRSRVTKNRNVAQTQTKHEQSERKKAPQPEKPLAKSTQSGKKQRADKGNSRIPHEQDEEEWTEAELMRLTEAVTFYPKHVAGYWAKVARIVGTRSAEECHNQHTSQGTSQTPAKKPKKRKEEAPKHPDNPVISARVGTLKRKQQVRQFLETMPKEDVDDVFSTAYMQTKRFEMPSMCPSEDNDFTLADLEPTTPISTGFPEVKTPQCLHITPGMMGSPNRSTDDKYVFQLQKRMKKRQFNVCKQAPPAKNLTPTPSVKKAMRRCGTTENDTFVVWEMFPGNDGGLCESGEEEDFYFSDND